jgi:hypothetical protein
MRTVRQRLDGDAEDVAGEIVEYGLLALAPRRAVDDPGLGPDGLRKDQVRTACRECGSELAVAPLAVDRSAPGDLDEAGPDCHPDSPQNPRSSPYPPRSPLDWREHAPTQASSSRVSIPCPPESGPSASDLRVSDGRIVSLECDVRVFHKGNFPSSHSVLIYLNSPSSIHSRTYFPEPLSVRRRRSRELFVSRFRYYYVLRLLSVHRFPFRFRL